MGEHFDRGYDWRTRPAGKSAALKAGMHRQDIELPGRWSRGEIARVREMLDCFDEDMAAQVIEDMQGPAPAPKEVKVRHIGSTVLDFSGLGNVNIFDPTIQIDEAVAAELREIVERIERGEL